jgi:hypothetical protein
MFSKNSRYRNLPESSAMDARGERPRGKELRIIPRPAGRFLYTVHDSDRLDLLAFKYYGDPTKWWQICDANPQPPFPTDLLDTRPLNTERFILTYPAFESRFNQLLIDLAAFGHVTTPDPGNESNPSLRGLLRSVLVVKYTTSLVTRGRIIAGLATRKFNFIGADGWPAVGGETIEAFTFDDPEAKLAWSSMMRALADAPGIVRVQSSVIEGLLEITYNGSIIERPVIISLITGRGFETAQESDKLSRVGEKIILPPNQTT